MKPYILAAAGALFISACAISVPVNGELSGVPAQGTATATGAGGSFEILNTRGLVCTGTYDDLTMKITITAPVTCNNGLTGTAIITRKTDMVSGTVIVRLSNGQTGRFVFGDLQFGAEFG